MSATDAAAPFLRPLEPRSAKSGCFLDNVNVSETSDAIAACRRSSPKNFQTLPVRDVLVVDLDGTLIRSDMIFETFWSAFTKNWASPLIAAVSMVGGRADLKRRMADLSDVHVASLPYNDEVVNYVRRWRAQGGRTVLATACDQSLANKIASHLGIFDEVYGSDAKTNLKGARKAAFLRDRFGDRGFAYIGDAEADIPVWQAAAKTITVNLSTPLKARVDAICGDALHLTLHLTSAKAYLKALRPHQWLKNLLIFVPMLAAHELTVETTAQSVLAFIAFSLVASSVYVLNDLLDLSADRAHPRKRYRPFASGDVPIAHGTWLVPLLLCAGLAFALPLGGSFILVILAYYAVTTAYSVYLKRRSVIDICVLAALYTMRVVAGGVATGIPVSVWLLAFCIFLFFALAAIKREAELIDAVASGEVTARGRSYYVDDSPVVANMAAAAGYVSVLVMALYINSPAVLELYTRPYALWGICLVQLYWISRMMIVTHRGEMHDDPLVYAVKDRVSELCLFLVVAFVAAGTFL